MFRLCSVLSMGILLSALVSAGCGDEATSNDLAGDAGTDARGDTSGDETGPTFCGDGAINGAEVCDATATPSGCTLGSQCNATCSTCTPTNPPACGDGTVNGAELCDGTAVPNGCSGNQACSNDCSTCMPAAEPACGDGAVNGEEVCDASALVSGCQPGRRCTGSCDACETPQAACGDGDFAAGVETCDGSDSQDDGCAPGRICNSLCTACEESGAPACGDGAVNGDEACDASALTSTGCELPEACNSTCDDCTTPTAGCGDGSNSASEVCDASDLLNSGCAAPATCASDCSECQPPSPMCGDGAVNGGEACDATASPAGCNEGQFCDGACTCQNIPETCGNNQVDEGETCDASAEPTGCDPGERCGPECLVCRPPACGNGAVDEDEACDQSADDNGCPDFSVCANDCSVCNDVCGNLILEGDEECDYDGIFGELGESCDIETQYCTDDCTCAPLILEAELLQATAPLIVNADAFLVESLDDLAPGVISFNVGILDELGLDSGGFTTFSLLFLDAEGTILDFLRPGRDLLVRSEFIGDDPNVYEWRFQAHLRFGPPAETAVAALVLFTEDGAPSNPVIIPTLNLIALGEACDSGAFFSECAPGETSFGFCPEESAECTELTDFLYLDELTLTRDIGTDTLTFDFNISDPDALGGVKQYWILGVIYDDNPDDAEGPFFGAAFEPFDELTDNDQGVITGSVTFEGAAEVLGVSASDILEAGAIVFDSARWDINFAEPVDE